MVEGHVGHAVSVSSRVDEPLPSSVVLSLSAGFLGMSVLVNVINTILVFFYLPPDTAGLPTLVTEATLLGVLNVIALVAAAGRFTDAVTDPLIAAWSDRSTHRRGRRIPFMAVGMVPAALATVAVFVPPVDRESGWNILWLFAVQLVLYVSLTAYATPAFAMVADLGANPAERLEVATWTSIAWAIGLLLGAQIFFIAPLLDGPLETYQAWQGSIAIVCLIALAFMTVPVVTIDEPRWTRNQPTTQPLVASLRTVLGNRFFRFYALADFSYFSGLVIIQTGVLFYVTVLLELEEWFSSVLLMLMVVVSVFLFPPVAAAARRRGGGKGLTVFAFLLSSVVFLTISALGLIDRFPFAQAAIPIAVFALPFAILSVMPQWILADISEHAVRTGGEAQAAMFYAARTFLQKLATTVGVVLFALLLQLGRDVGDDLGVRMTGIAGAALYALAAVLFSFYDEERLQRELAEAGQESEFGDLT